MVTQSKAILSKAIPARVRQAIKLLFVISIFLISPRDSMAQRQLIPTTGGSFESDTSFASNGWTDVQDGANRYWQIGDPAGAASGIYAAYLGNPGNNNGANAAGIRHFYRDVVIPPQATNVQMAFYFKRTTSSGADPFRVFVTTPSNTPVANVMPGAGYTTLFSNSNTNYASFTRFGPYDFSAYVGTTVRLVFTAQENGSNPRANPSVDSVTISAIVPPLITGFAATSGCPNSSVITITGTYLLGASSVTIGGQPVNSILTNTDTSITAIVGSGNSGPVRVTTSMGSFTTSSNFTFVTAPIPFNVNGGGSFCLGAGGVQIGLSGTETGVFYTLSPAGTVVAGTGSPISFGYHSVGGTYTVSASRSVPGCTVPMTGSATVTVLNPVQITGQPASQSACLGGSVTLSVTASGTSPVYQWYKGSVALSNGGSISGSQTASLTINPVDNSHNGSDYTCVVSNTCNAETSVFAAITVTPANTAPVAQPTLLSFPSISATSISGSFTPSVSANGYLVIRSLFPTISGTPADGTSYAVGSTAFGPSTVVEYSGPGSSFTSTGLFQGITYYYWVFAYNTSACGTSPMYLVPAPLTGSATTLTNVACGSINTLYWAGTGSSSSNPAKTTDFNTASNWSTSGSSYVAAAAAPTACTFVVMNITLTATVTLSANVEIYGINYTAQSGATARLSTQGFQLTVNNEAYIDLMAGASNNTNIRIGENSGTAAGIVDFRGNVVFGTNAAAAGSNKYTYLIGNSNSRFIFRGNVNFGLTTFVSGGARPGLVIFDGNGLQQITWNNTMYTANFLNVQVGNTNSPTVLIRTGNSMPDNILGNLTLNNAAVLDLGTSQWNRDANGGSLTMNGTSRLILGNNVSSVHPKTGTGQVINGSNFPGGFTTLTLAVGSTIEYDANETVTQTIRAITVYRNLVVTNGSGTGTALKTNTSTVNVSGSATLQNGTRWNLGANISSSGSVSVQSGATLYTQNSLVSGTGSFSLLTGATLGIGSVQGITASGASGSIQTNTRSFSTGANYHYIGTSLMDAGNGLPNLVNDLLIDNAASVVLPAASANYEVGGHCTLTSGPLVINGNTFIINTLSRTTGTLSGNVSSNLTIKGASVPLFFTAGARFIRNLTIQDNASAVLGTALEMVGGSSYGTLTMGTAALLNSNGRLTLRSTSAGTARVAELPADPFTGAALATIQGNVTVERFVSAQKAWRLLGVPTDGTQTIYQSWQEAQAPGSTSLSGRGLQISGETFPSNGFDMLSTVPSVKIWNPASGTYTGISSTYTAIANTEAYMVFFRGDRTVNNQYQAPTSTTLRTSGNLKTGRYPGTALTVQAGQFRALANPYASAINFNNLLRTGGIPNTFYVWDPMLTTGTGSRYGVGGFRTITWDPGSSTYIVTPAGGSYTTNTDIESGAAFFVYAPVSSGTIQFQENAKTTGGSLVSRPGAPNGRQLAVKLSTLLNGDSILLDGALVQFGENYRNQFDELDAVKLGNSGENIGIRLAGKTLSVERRALVENIDTIQLQLGQLRSRTYQLALDASQVSENGQVQAWLIDRFLQTRTALDLEQTNRVLFTVSNAAGAAAAANRFYVVFSRPGTQEATRITRFQARRLENRAVALDWQVIRELQIHHYELERSRDGQTFETLSRIEPMNNQGEQSFYQDRDATAPLQTVYYRIRAVRSATAGDILSTVVMLPVASAPSAETMAGKSGVALMDEPMEDVKAWSIYPNPVQQKTIRLNWKGISAGQYTIKLISQDGKPVHQSRIRVQQGQGNANCIVPETIPAGTYLVQILGEADAGETLQIIIL